MRDAGARQACRLRAVGYRASGRSCVFHRIQPVPRDRPGGAQCRRGDGSMSEQQHRIVMGAAGGLPVATRLGNRYGRKGRVRATLVDRNATHVWKPLLHEVAAGRMDADAHALDYLAIAYWHHFRFRQGAVRGLDRARREVMLDAVLGPEGDEILPRRTLPYDTLILCLGSVSNDFGVPGASLHPISLDTLY